MKIGSAGGEPEKLKMNMMPMIDVCFQLIIFFMLSLRLYSPEGDFRIKMPLAAPQQGLPDETQTPPVKIRLTADSQGNLAGHPHGRTGPGLIEGVAEPDSRPCGPRSRPRRHRLQRRGGIGLRL